MNDSIISIIRKENHNIQISNIYWTYMLNAKYTIWVHMPRKNRYAVLIYSKYHSSRAIGRILTCYLLTTAICKKLHATQPWNYSAPSKPDTAIIAKSSCPFTLVKARRFRSVHGWVTTWEARTAQTILYIVEKTRTMSMKFQPDQLSHNTLR